MPNDRKETPMDFDKGQMAIIEKTAFSVAEKIEQRLKDSFAQQIQMHEARCPTTAKVIKIEDWPTQAKIFSKGFVFGMLALASLLGGSAALGVAKILKLFT